MPVTQIFLLRHGHRMAWTLDPTSGTYTSTHPFPTRLPADPPLASHGVDQSHETATHFTTLFTPLVKSDTLRVYSSLFYRCLETLRPTMDSLRQINPNLTVRGERGIGEWFGHAPFDQPVPATPARLKGEFFGFVDEQYESLVVPARRGERIHEIHDRLARALDAVVRAVEAEFEGAGRGGEEVTLLMCGHAAQIIAAGRVLTGSMPEDPDVEDFRCFTCGISKFVRRRTGTGASQDKGDVSGWRTNGGVAGGWDCELNSWCGHLSQGEERGWHFHGDESFDSYAPGSVIVEDGGVEDSKGSPKL